MLSWKRKKKSPVPHKDTLAWLKETPLFQETWYLQNNPDVLKNGMDPADHYRLYGEAEGRRPNPYFDPRFYSGKSTAARAFKGLLLEHFATRGWKNGVNPSAEFSLRLFGEAYSDLLDDTINPLSYFIENAAAGRLIHFPEAAEYEGNETVASEMMLVHKSGLFKRNWYSNYYDDLWYAAIDPLFHYVIHGIGEHRDPNPYFDARWYTKEHKKNIGNATPLNYFCAQGREEQHNPSPNFCSKTYAELYKDFDPEIETALAHYLRVGQAEGRPRPIPGMLAKQGQKKLDKDSKLPISNGLRGMIDLARNDLSPESLEFNPKSLNIHWVIPDFTRGGGGHMTIFRMIHFLERMGHKATIWINDPSIHETPEAACETILKHYKHIVGNVHFIGDENGPDFADASGDIIVATDCWTVWPVLAPTNFKRRFYFVQDFEPSFHPMGANYLAAERTYFEDLDCICASPWLSNLMQEKYGRWAKPFWLSADTDTYWPAETKKINKRTKIAVYARHYTARRAVELAFTALEKLAKNGVDFEVEFFGAPLPFETAPFRYTDHGVASPEMLADIFRKCDIGVVFSATNYSLVPQEMMACGLPLLELKGDNTEAIFPDGVAMLTDPDPRAIADALSRLIDDVDLRKTIAKNGYEWVQQFSWSASAKIIEEAFLERLNEFGSPKLEETATSNIPPKASVVIPTYNAGPKLKDVLDMVTTQDTPWPYEILVIDSGSKDGTIDLVKSYEQVKLHAIDSKDFNHGGTRNLGVELTKGEYIAFLTHDALPANHHWLYALVTSIERYPNAAGAFGKHLAYPDASMFTKRDLDAHFTHMGNHALCLNSETKPEYLEKTSDQWQQVLHFYSDNNSCFKRSVWQEIPYQHVAFGEDQLWAADIIKAGYDKIYAPQAVVYHSHDYDTRENRERCATESAFFKHFFGYELIADEDILESTLSGLNERDQLWGEEHGLDQDTIDRQKALNESRLQGYLEGCLADTAKMF